MTRNTQVALVLAGLVLGAAQEAHAQYFYPYGRGYAGGGWGGWASTPGGDIARGMGVYAAGAGVYNYDTAVARSINTDTVMRWNQYLFESQQETNRRYARLQAERFQRRDEAFDAIQKRLRENPSLNDIYRGDALNALLDDLTNPKVTSASSLRVADLNVPGRLIRTIPFFYASDAVTLCLSKLTDESSWPANLQTAEFAPLRETYIKAVKVVVKEDEEGDPKPEDVAKVRAAVKALMDKAEIAIPKDPRDGYLRATNYLKGLAGVARMMEKPNFQKVLEDLDPSKQATVGQLLGFMQNYNLRFGPATDGDQRAAYQELYKMLSSQRPRILAESSNAPAPKNVKGAPTDLFKDVESKHLVPAPPAPKQP